jgi:hypothetical protein
MILIEPPKQHSWLWKLFHQHHWYFDSSSKRMTCDCSNTRPLTKDEFRIYIYEPEFHWINIKKQLKAKLDGLSFDPQPPIKS